MSLFPKLVAHRGMRATAVPSLLLALYGVGCYSADSDQSHRPREEKDGAIQSGDRDSGPDGAANCARAHECSDASMPGSAGSGGRSGTPAGSGATPAADASVVDAATNDRSDAGLPSDDGLLPPEFNPGCRTHSDCAYLPKGCCEPCRRATAEDYYAVAADRVDDVRERLMCATTSCADCAGLARPELNVACIEGICRMVDLTERPEVSACAAHQDCMLRFAGCCECDSAVTNVVIAVSNVEAYEELVCRDGAACGDCELRYPADAVPFCKHGQCQVARPMPIAP
jgi:hypothetical protein